MSLFDEDLDFDKPVTEEWLLSKGFCKIRMGPSIWDATYKKSDEIKYIHYVWDWKISISLYTKVAQYLVVSDSSTHAESLTTRGQIINLMNSYK